MSKQKENSENFNKLIKKAKEKNIKLLIINEGDKITLENNVYIKILWPTETQEIGDNALNNNSIVAKLVSNNFSVLFTGDIEEPAEKAILKKYSNNLNELKSTILKVAHHGSKTSSIEEFLEAVSPKIALIGVGKNNTFGHPNDKTLEKLKSLECKIYRTDEKGEITITYSLKEKVLQVHTLV